MDRDLPRGALPADSAFVSLTAMSVRILIVEGDPLAALDLGGQLAAQNYSVAGMADTGERAVVLAGKLNPDLILMEIGPGNPMEGVSAAIHIREQLGLPVIFLTTSDEDSILERAKHAEPVGYLVKPIDSRNLRAAIEMGLHQHRVREELRRKLAMLDKFASQVPGMLYQFVRRPDGTYCLPFSTERIKVIFGLRPEEVRDDATPIFHAIVAEDRSKIAASIESSARHMTPWQCEYRVQLPGHPIRWLWGESVPEKLADGSIIWHGFNRDITENKRAEQAVVESEELFRIAFFTSPDSININRLDDGRYVMINQGFSRITGYASEEVIGKTSLELSIWVDPSDREKLVQGLKRDGFVHNLEARYQMKDGRIRMGLMSATVIHLKGVPHILSITRDIEDLRSTQEALRLSERRYRTLYETMTQGVVYQDAAGIILSANPAAEKLLGLTLEQMQGRSSLDPRWRSTHEDGSVFPGDEHPAILSLKTGKPVRNVIMGVFHPLREDYVWLKVDAHPQFRENETKPWQVYAMFDDITERKRAEAALRQSEEKFRAVVECSPTAMYIYRLESEDRLILMGANPSTDRVLGMSHQALLGKTIEEAFPKLAETEIPDMYRRVARGETGPQSFEITYQDERISGFYHVHVFRTGPASIAVAFDEISERKRAELALRASLEEKEALIKEVHHRVKNNLQIVGSLLNLQASRVKDPASLAALHDTQHRIRSMALVHETLYRSGNLARIKVSHYLKNLCQFLSSFHHRSEVSVRLCGEATEVEMEIDQAIPCGLIVNELVTNALKHAFPQGRSGEVRVVLRAPDCDLLVLAVSDDGVGLPAGATPESSQTLGLQLVLHLAKQLRAALEIKREPGTQFVLTIPLSCGEAGNRPPDCRAQGGEPPTILEPSPFNGRPQAGEGLDETGDLDSPPARRPVPKGVEETWLEPEQKWRQILLTTPQIVISLDPEGRIVFANQHFCLLTGWSQEEVLGQNWFEMVIPPEVREKVRNIFGAVMRAANTLDYSVYENEIRTRGGQRRTVAWSNVLTKNRQGAVVDVTCLGVDLTERQRAEAALRRSEREKELLLNSTVELFCYYDLELRIQWANQAAASSVGLKPDQLVGHHCYQIWHRQTEPCPNCPVLQARETRQGQQLELMTPDGRYWSIRGYPVFDEKGDMVGLTEFGQDITERKQAELALRASLEEKTVLLKELHHRVKNNLQIVGSLLRLQANRLQEADSLAALQDAQNRVRSISLVHEILYRSSNLARIKLLDYLQSLCAHLRNSFSAQAPQVSLSVELSDSSLDLPVDQATPYGLIINELVTNAFKHAFPEGRPGQIRVSLQAGNEADSRLKMVVTDNGVGWPPALDVENPTTVGLQLVGNLARQLRSTLSIHRESGATTVAILPISEIHEKFPPSPSSP